VSQGFVSVFSNHCIILDSDSETTLAATTRTIRQTRKPFSTGAFRRIKTVGEDSRREGFVRKEEKKRPKGRYGVGEKKIPVSDNRAVDIHVGPVKGMVSEYEFLGKILSNSCLQLHYLLKDICI